MPLGGKLAATGEALSMQPVAYDVAAGPSFSGLFAIPRGAEQLSLQRELYAVAHRGEAVNSRLRAEVGPSGDAAADSLAALAGTGGAEAWGAGTTGKDGAGQTRGGALGTPAGQGPLNQDVFLEMLMKMRQVREQKPAAGPSSAPAQPDGTAPGLAVGMAPGTALTATGGPRTLVEIGKDRALVIHGLAGQSKDLFNLNMARAGAEMKSRRYYDAANTYETAGLVDPRNPLAHVGMGLSLLGAGESLSAAYQLSQAVSLFPPLMETRIDLPGMVDQKVIDAHLDRLDARIAAADPESKRMLQFLAAFLYRNSNRPDQAKTYAEQLLTTSKNNAVLRAYADLILTGKTPGEKEGGIGKLGVEPATPKLLPLPGGVILPTTRPAKPATLPSVTPRVGNTPDKGAKADKKGAGPAK
jgi:hypothetical protein